MAKTQLKDEKYLAIIRDALEICRGYSPQLGKGRKSGYSLSEFQDLYRQDPFYAWFGLDSPLVYAAHKAAGGMTSLYRQIGIAGERLFRQIIRDSLGLTVEQSEWKYDVPGTQGRKRTLSLDARIRPSDVTKRGPIVRDWLREATRYLELNETNANRLEGIVFEVRQGYKSKDSKRQNADIANAANAYAHGYLPSLVVLSTQFDSDLAERYMRARWLRLTGTLTGSNLTSTYLFCREVLGYDLAGFFKRNSAKIKKDVESIIKGLLK